jgi:ABC-type transport system involved in multi-copper enzyme maturation permease subunit
MNTTLILSLLRQRLFSPGRAVLIATCFGFPLLIAAVMPGARFNPADLLFVLILGAGMVGQDVSSGVLSGILARPVRRAEYVVSRWVAVALGASALVFVQTGLAWIIVTMRGAGLESAAMGATAVGSVFTVIGVSAVLLLLSCCVNGMGDLAVFLVGSVFAKMIETVGSFKSWGWLTGLGTELNRFLSPQLDLTQLHGSTFSAFALASYLSTLTLCLALAIVLVNRKELSYAAG